jgi:hypothetical protein
MESVLNAIEQADYADETDIYREWLAELDDPEKVTLNGEPYSIVDIQTEYIPTMGVTNARLKEQKGKPDTRCVGLSCEGDILILTTYSSRNRVWEKVDSVQVGETTSS